MAVRDGAIQSIKHGQINIIHLNTYVRKVNEFYGKRNVRIILRHSWTIKKQRGILKALIG